MADAVRESIEHFVRVTLGCRCPDEVFESIAVRRETGGSGTAPLTRLVVGNRLLIYVVDSNHALARPGNLEALARRGRAERDDGRLNRFRLVVAAAPEAHSGDAAPEAFSRVAAGDVRMHLHVLPPGAIPASLRVHW